MDDFLSLEPNAKFEIDDVVLNEILIRHDDVDVRMSIICPRNEIRHDVLQTKTDTHRERSVEPVTVCKTPN